MCVCVCVVCVCVCVCVCVLLHVQYLHYLFYEVNIQTIIEEKIDASW